MDAYGRWGLHCYPNLRMAFAVVYYSTAALAVLSSLQVIHHFS